MSDPSKKQTRLHPTNLEMANQMFKDAFAVKKMRFSLENPNLTKEELHTMTADYFRNLSDEKKTKGDV